MTRVFIIYPGERDYSLDDRLEAVAFRNLGTLLPLLESLKPKTSCHQVKCRLPNNSRISRILRSEARGSGRGDTGLFTMMRAGVGLRRASLA